MGRENWASPPAAPTGTGGLPCPHDTAHTGVIKDRDNQLFELHFHGDKLLVLVAAAASMGLCYLERCHESIGEGRRAPLALAASPADAASSCDHQLTLANLPSASSHWPYLSGPFCLGQPPCRHALQATYGPCPGWPLLLGPPLLLCPSKSC